MKVTINQKFLLAQRSIFNEGNRKYLDLSFGAGTLLLGHQSKIFKQSLNSITSKKLSLIAIK